MVDELLLPPLEDRNYVIPLRDPRPAAYRNVPSNAEGERPRQLGPQSKYRAGIPLSERPRVTTVFGRVHYLYQPSFKNISKSK
ncbi:hypothetical protein NPIL_401251 [Nephila pilipes]|uniref:Uncharacterized protein n=1 Tax=Nephila pilipes TaxID=299642 RepID=A0A8X6N2X5_NEPPI|nr:hypothetical protein NPIL_401251 [Nephila pilipes]